MRTFVGIDPGLSGAVAVVDERGRVVGVDDAPTIGVRVGKKNRTLYVEAQMVALLESVRDGGDVVMVALENVHAMPGQGVTSMFSMGQGFGLWIGILAALRLPYTRVEPARWKKEMGIAAKSEKSASVVRALQLFPRADVRRAYKRNGQTLYAMLDGRADAILLAEHARRSEKGA